MVIHHLVEQSDRTEQEGRNSDPSAVLPRSDVRLEFGVELGEQDHDKRGQSSGNQQRDAGDVE
jgi:hypothetical protein